MYKQYNLTVSCKYDQFQHSAILPLLGMKILTFGTSKVFTPKVCATCTQFCFNFFSDAPITDVHLLQLYAVVIKLEIKQLCLLGLCIKKKTQSPRLLYHIANYVTSAYVS